MYGLRGKNAASGTAACAPGGTAARCLTISCTGSAAMPPAALPLVRLAALPLDDFVYRIRGIAASGTAALERLAALPLDDRHCRLYTCASILGGIAAIAVLPLI